MSFWTDMGQDLIEEKTIVKPMKYVKTTFKTFLKHRLNESVKLKTKEEEQPIEDMETDDEEDLEDIDPEDEPEETPIRKFPKKKKDNVDELVSEYKKLKMEWENLFKEKQ